MNARQAQPGDVMVVGNGHSALVKQGSIGNDINTFDDVVRFNSYILEGFEQSVGTKMTVYATYGNTNVTKKRLWQPHHHVIVTAPCGRAGPSQRKYMDLLRRENVSYEQINCGLYRDVRRELREYAQGHVEPSSGLLICEYYLRLGRRPVIHGFDHFAPNSVRHYYAGALEKEKRARNGHDGAGVHKWSAEQEWFRRRLEDGSIVRLVDE